MKHIELLEPLDLVQLELASGGYSRQEIIEGMQNFAGGFFTGTGNSAGSHVGYDNNSWAAYWGNLTATGVMAAGMAFPATFPLAAAAMLSKATIDFTGDLHEGNYGKAAVDAAAALIGLKNAPGFKEAAEAGAASLGKMLKEAGYGMIDDAALNAAATRAFPDAHPPGEHAPNADHPATPGEHAPNADHPATPGEQPSTNPADYSQFGPTPDQHGAFGEAPTGPSQNPADYGGMGPTPSNYGAFGEAPTGPSQNPADYGGMGPTPSNYGAFGEAPTGPSQNPSDYSGMGPTSTNYGAFGEPPTGPSTEGIPMADASGGSYSVASYDGGGGGFSGGGDA